MKKIVLTLATLAFIFANCTNEIDEPRQTAFASVPLKLTVTMPATPQPAAGSSRIAFEKDANNPLKLIAKWHTGDQVVLILFQGDNASWKSNCLIHKIAIPTSAVGQSYADLTTAAGTINLSSFDDSQPLKYVVTTGYTWNDENKQLTLGNGFPDIHIIETLNKQLNDMVFASPVKEVPFPTESAPLQLNAQLEWLTAVLALKFNIPDPLKNADLPVDQKLYFQLTNSGGSYIDCYDPVLREKIYGSSSHPLSAIKYISGKRLIDALDAGYFRYFTIPADDAADGVKISGSELQGGFASAVPSTLPPIGTMNPEKPILPGKCYGFEIDVNDANNDGIPEFTKHIPTGPAPPYSMIFTTSFNVGATINLGVYADPTDQDDVWIDWDNDGVRDPGENPKTFGGSTNYTLKSQTFTIHGKVTMLFCNQCGITSLEINNSELWQIQANTNYITEAEMTKLVNSMPDRTGKTQGGYMLNVANEFNASHEAILTEKNWKKK